MISAGLYYGFNFSLSNPFKEIVYDAFDCDDYKVVKEC